MDLVQTAARYLASAWRTRRVAHPEVIVIGGGLARIGSTLLDPCIRAMRENLQPVFADVVRIVPSTLWDEAGLIGAAALAWRMNATPRPNLGPNVSRCTMAPGYAPPLFQGWQLAVRLVLEPEKSTLRIGAGRIRRSMFCLRDCFARLANRMR